MYLTGPMAELPEHNYPEFRRAATFLRSKGISVYNPVDSLGNPAGLPRERYMRTALPMLLMSAAVVVLPGWEESADTQLQLVTAAAGGIRIYTLADFSWYISGNSDELPELDFMAATRETESPRASVLSEAIKITTGDRNNSYGPPTQDFQRTAEILTALGFAGPNGSAVKSHHVAMIIMAVKLSRLTWSPNKRDNWVDMAGYAGCGYECTLTEGTENGSRNA